MAGYSNSVMYIFWWMLARNLLVLWVFRIFSRSSWKGNSIFVYYIFTLTDQNKICLQPLKFLLKSVTKIYFILYYVHIWNSNKTLHRWTQRITTKICSPGTENTEATNWKKHLNGNFEKLLEAECYLTGQWKSPVSHSLSETPMILQILPLGIPAGPYSEKPRKTL